MPHWLDPLLRPKSIAVVGASSREGSVGYVCLANLLKGGYEGTLYAVNPKAEPILGVPCYASLSDLPIVPDHVAFTLSDNRLEAALDEAIALGVKAATLMSTLVLHPDTDPPLKERVTAKIRAADMVVCGGNGMGFYNFHNKVWVCGFETREHRPPGNVALISQSGSGMCGIVDVEERIDFNLAVSTGQELATTIADYLDFALDLPETRVVGLFIETVRDVHAMRKALEKANAKRIPVVAIKVGITEKAAKLALSHTGALAGDDAAYQAFFDQYGVQRVADTEELATALIMFAQPHPVGPGGLVSMHDSGGVRQLVVDLAASVGTPMTELSPTTVATLEETLEPDLPAINPLDAWSAGGSDFTDRAAGYLTTMLKDEGASMAAVIQDREAGGLVTPEYLDYVRKAHKATGKPGFLVSGRQGTGPNELAIEGTREGLPVLDSVIPFLRGAKLMMAYRDFCERPKTPSPQPDEALLKKWRFAATQTLHWDEAMGAALLADFGLPALPYHITENCEDAVKSAAALGWPVVMKTAEPGIAHKSDVGGVHLNLANEKAVEKAYLDLAARLGPRVVMAPMIKEPGVEMILGLTHDPQLGPLVMFGFGGIHAEVLKDVVFLIPPFDTETARTKLDELKLRPLLDGVRGAPPANIDAFLQTAADFSQMAAQVNHLFSEIDVNPLLVTNKACYALDALVVPKTTSNS